VALLAADVLAADAGTSLADGEVGSTVQPDADAEPSANDDVVR
jgi:hypothetical protein